MRQKDNGRKSCQRMGEQRKKFPMCRLLQPMAGGSGEGQKLAKEGVNKRWGKKSYFRGHITGIGCIGVGRSRKLNAGP